MGEMTNKRIATNICKRLQDAGFEAVFAGGAVRDMILGIEPNDYDVATNAAPIQIKKLFNNSKFVGESFGVSIVNGIEVATFRQENNYTDGRRPDTIKFCSSMKDDALRRDLTINALFFDPISEEIHDFVKGKCDISLGIIDFVGNPRDRINEDVLRILRAVRFKVRFGFQIDLLTEVALMESGSKLEALSGERIFEELKKGLSLDDPAEYINQLKKLNLLKFILPEIHSLIGCEQNRKWHPEGATVQKIIYD